MEQIIYILFGYANDTPAELWAVMAFADAQAAEKYRQEADSASNRIIHNVKRATMIRGKPFSHEEIARFCANNNLDPNMKFSESGISYRLLEVPLASGLELGSNQATTN